MIIDGFGIAVDNPGNSISQAIMPNWEHFLKSYPNTSIDASGSAVGLPDRVMGNSEVGHITIGSGRINYQSLQKINRGCNDGSLSQHPLLEKIVRHTKTHHSSLHLMGLVSDGGVHSHVNHLYFLLEEISKRTNANIWIHAFTDGRDTPPDSSIRYVEELQHRIDLLSNASLASIVGRYYAMDRDNKWDRTKIAFDLLTKMDGPVSGNPIVEIQHRYNNHEFDEFLKPIICNPTGKIRDGDAVLFFNFRPDRARQITKAINGMHPLGKSPKNLFFVTMTRYEESWEFPVFYDNEEVVNSLAEVISKYNLHQLHIAETEKYAHMTYFINGGEETPFPGEERILIPSLRVDTYDTAPEMSTQSITAEVIKNITSEKFSIIMVNIASPDMVGHTGIIPATIEALQSTDEALGNIYESCNLHGYTLIVTSDHGNCEKMLDNQKPHTAHTTNKVPFVITRNVILQENGGLQNVAPTILDLMNLAIPKEMTGKSLLVK